MDNFGAITIPPQNFAVSSVKPLQVGPRERGAFFLPEELDRMENAVTQAWERWWDLFCAPDVWTNPQARRAMCSARLEYQDAVFELADACTMLRLRELL